ncbi:MAG: hypothetical protein RJB66_109 [Pseudomonadota bacterium]|jgi:RPA family protein
MKILIARTLLGLTLLTSSNAWSSDGDKDASAQFESHKTQAVKAIDEQIESLNKFKGCVNGSMKPEDIRHCRKEHRDAMKGLRADLKEKHLEKMKDHREKMDEKIKKLESQKSEEKK